MTGNGSTLFVASAWDNVYRSADNGTTWQIVNQGLPRLSGSTTQVSISPRDISVLGSTVFLADGYGLYRSLDNGTSWAEVGPPSESAPNSQDYYSVLVDASGILAFTSYGTVWRSTDNGTTWQITFKLPTTAEGRFVQGNGVVFLATRSGGIYYSHDNGVTWRFMQGSVNALALRETFSCTATDTDILVGVPCWYGTNCNGVYKTSYTALPSSNQAFSLSGNAGAPALITLNRPFGTPLTTTASVTGEYSFPGVTDGAYTVVPTLADHTFTPTNASVTISGSNQSGVNFTARAGAPAAPVGNFAFLVPASPLGSTSLTLSWNPPAGGAAGYTIVLSESLTAPAGTPQQGDVFTGDAAFNGMTMPPFNGQVVYDGAATTVTITGLTPNTGYSAVAYPYNGSGGARSYFVQTPATTSAQTLDMTLPPVNVSVGSITLVPPTLNFGDVPRGTSYTRSYTMNYANLTTASITLTPPAAWEISVGNAAFSAAPVLWATLATVGQVNVRARFTPNLNGTFSGDITHSAGSTSAMVRVGGSSTPPSITVSTLTLNFGSVAPSSTATKAYRVSYRNLVTRSITLTPPTGFTISTSTTGTFSGVPLTVSTRVTGSFNVYVQFIPTALGKQSGTLQNDNFDAGTIALFVEGEGVYPTVALSRSDLDFGGVPQGTCKTLSYTLTPAGGVSWQATQICPPASGNVQISTTGPNGPFTSSCRSVIFARVGGVRSQQVWVRYCPTTDADLDEVITHTTEPGGLEERLFLTGFGARPDITVLNPSINFGTINLGATASAILRVRYGNVTLPGNITLSTTSTHPFTFDNSALGTTNATLTTSATATGATFSVVVKFTPTAAGLFTNTFTAELAAANGTTTDTFTFTGRANGAAITANNNQTLNFNGNFLLTPNTRSFPLRYDNITTNTIEISPTAHPAFLLMDPQTGVFSTTAGISLTVGGTAANPVSSTSMLFVRFLPLRGGATSATLTFISAPMGGSTSASKTLNLSGSGLAPFMSATTATNQGTLRFNAVPFGDVHYYLYSLSYRNITSGTITVNVPVGSAFDVTESSSGTWTTAGQTLTLSNIPATSATMSVSLWVRYSANNTVTTRSTFAHVSVGGDAITNISENLVCIGTSLLPTVTVSPGTINFASTGITKSSLASYQIDYQNITTQTIRLQAQSGFGFSTTATGPFTTVGTLTIRTPGTDGSLPMWALFTASTTTQISATIAHTALDALGSVIASDDLRCVGRGKPHLAVYERGDWGCTPISPLQTYTFNVKQPARAGDVRSEGKIIRIEHIGINQPIKIVASEGYVLSVGGDKIVSPATYTYYDCAMNSTITITKPNDLAFEYLGNHAIHSSTADITVDQAKYQVYFLSAGTTVERNNFEVWVTSVAPTSCGRQGTITISSGTASTTLTVTTVCQPEQTLCVSDNKRLIPDDKLLLHTYTSSPLPLYPVIENWLNGRPGQWYICNPYNPTATIRVAEAWKVFDFQGSSKSMIGAQDGYVWDKHPDFIDGSGKSKVRLFNASTLSGNLITSDFDNHGTSIMSSAAAIGHNGLGIAGIDWKTNIISAGGYYENSSNVSIPSYVRFPEYSTKVREIEEIEFRSNSHSYGTNTLGTDFHKLYKHDMVTVASAVNNGEKGSLVANTTPWAIIVGSCNFNDEWGGTNFGEGLDIVAPGTEIMGAAYKPSGKTPTDPSLVVTGERDLYSWWYVSSSSSGPIVSGTVSLMLGYAREKLNNKYLSNEDVTNILRLSADKVRDKQSPNNPNITRKVNGQVIQYDYKIGGSPRTAYLQDGWDQYMGHGRLNVCKALWYVRDGFLHHYTTPYSEKPTSMPGVIFGLTDPAVAITHILDAESIVVTPSTFATLNYNNLKVQKVEVRKTIRFAELNIIPSTSTTIKVWGMGSKMAGNGFANIYSGLSPAGLPGGSAIFDAGWCQPVAGTVTNSEAILQTFVYQLVSATNKNTDVTETFSNVWFPCKPEDVVFKYSVFGIPVGQSPCDDPIMIAKGSDGSLTAEGNTYDRLPHNTDALPLQVELLQNRPNPFGGETSIEYMLPERSAVRIEVFDVLGRRVLEPVNGIHTAGRHSITVNLSSFTSGMYIARLQTVQESGTIVVKTIRMMLAK